MAQTEEFTHFQPLGGSDDAETATGASGLTEATPAYTPLMLNGAGLLVKWDGAKAGTAVGVLALNAEAGPGKLTLYKSGTFLIKNLLWPEGISDLIKQNAFIGTSVSVI